jgi:acid phosphatase family membrane protein YuiD
VLRLGWTAPETAFALAFGAITVFDAVRVRSAAQEQRRVMRDLVLSAPDAGPWRRQVAGYLDILAHTPAHVAAGLIWGFLFALAVGTI